jgi:hypothetical protein
MLDNGVKGYLTGSITINVHFPIDHKGKLHKCCKYCDKFCRYEQNYNRYSCKLTGEWLFDIEHEIGLNCPLKFEEEKNEI